MSATSFRTHTCGELTTKSIGEIVTLCGWAQRSRDHGGLIFIDLRDKYGETQFVFDPQVSEDAHSIAESIRREFCLRVEGQVRERSVDTKNSKIPTGDIEVVVTKIDILAKSPTPPFDIEKTENIHSDVRYKYRYLDMRNSAVQSKLAARSIISHAMRESLVKIGFTDIETPLLVRSTPEGARDFVVPSRLQPGKFYALPQSPQIYKQLLMVGGCDRYFQIAKCLRDEDLRQDRQPEFTQLDMEMSFVSEADILNVVEDVIKASVSSVREFDAADHFEKIKHRDSIDRFGTDKPDLRFDLELVDITQQILLSNFQLAKDAVKRGGVAKAICVSEDLSRTYLNSLIEFALEIGAKGLAYTRVQDDGASLDGTIGKLFPSEVVKNLISTLGAKSGDTLLIVADKFSAVTEVLGQVRSKIGSDFKLADETELRFVWVVDFPLFELDQGKLTSSHHVFTAPAIGENLDEGNPLAMLSRAYDLVLNGVELGSGSIRNSDVKIQRKILRKIGLSDEEIESKFGFLLEALSFGAPPHGGIAIGLDRLVALILGTSDIREVIAFPKTKNGEGLVDKSPSELSAHQLDELHIRVRDRIKD
jgi:aspartyl-tRNA synthetase